MQAAARELAANSGAAGSWIQRKIERAHGEITIDARTGSNRDDVAGAEQRHLQPAVLLQFKTGVGRERLADGESDFFVAIVDAAPFRRRSVASQAGRKTVRRLGHA